MLRSRQLSSAALGMRPGFFAVPTDSYRTNAHELLPLHVGDSYLQPHPRLRELLHRPWHNDDMRYGDPGGLAELRAALADKLRARNGISWATPDLVRVANGATHALAMAVGAVISPGEEVILATPYWPIIHGIVGLANGRAVEAPLSQALYADEAASVDTLLAPYLSDQTAALYLASPNNPDGKVLSLAQAREISAFAQRHDLWLIVDEAYEDYVYDNHQHISIASLPGMSERTITVYSFSKCAAAAGVRLGYVVAPEAVSDAIGKMCNHTVYTPPFHLQRAFLDALPVLPEFTEGAGREFAKLRRLVASRLQAPAYSPQGGCFVFIDFRAYLPSDAVDCRPVLDEAARAGVMMAHGAGFGSQYGHHARLCFTARPPSEISTAIDRINRVLSARADRATANDRRWAAVDRG